MRREREVMWLTNEWKRRENDGMFGANERMLGTNEEMK
jgi:hypothetical protein